MSNSNIVDYGKNHGNLLIIDKKHYDDIDRIYNLIVSEESINILLLCRNVTYITFLLPDEHPAIHNAKYYHDTLTSLLPMVILTRYKLDIDLIDTKGMSINIWNYNDTNSYFIYNDIIKIYYFQHSMFNYFFPYYKIIMDEHAECKPINNLYRKAYKLAVNNRDYHWCNISYGIKKLVTLIPHNNKTPYKCKVKLNKHTDR